MTAFGNLIAVVIVGFLLVAGLSLTIIGVPATPAPSPVPSGP